MSTQSRLKGEFLLGGTASSAEGAPVSTQSRWGTMRSAKGAR